MCFTGVAIGREKGVVVGSELTLMSIDRPDTAYGFPSANDWR
jgi:hypothetical protein